MAAKKGKTKSGKVAGMKSRKLSADQAGQVKGGAPNPGIVGFEGIKNQLGHKDTVAWKWTGGFGHKF